MSYYTKTQIAWHEPGKAAEDLPIERVVAAARDHLRRVEWPQDAADDLEQGFRSKGLVEPSFVDLQSSEIVAMFASISAALPHIDFYVRGMGEEHFDIWAAHLKNGQVLVEHGPFH